jgi:hydroxyethylthiazole kinase-like uncharacterized protein yjeF
MIVITKEEMQDAEKRAFASNLNQENIIEKAGVIIAQEAWVNTTASKNTKIIILVGPGNNGSDGLVAARFLSSWKATVTILLISKRNDLNKYLKDEQKNIKCIEMIKNHEARTITKKIKESECIIDALYGIGWDINRKQKTDEYNLKKLLDKIQLHRDRQFILCVDIPTGVDANTGQCIKNTLTADMTITFGAIKIGMTQQPGSSKVGNIIIEGLGIDHFIKERSSAHIISKNDFHKNIIKRKSASNKGHFGKILVIAGSRIYPGAAILTCEAAAIAGAGIITLASSKFVQQINITKQPELTLFDTGNSEYLDESIFPQLIRQVDNFNAIVIGPGISQNKRTVLLINKIIEFLKKNKHSIPLILDADGLNILAKMENWPFKLSKNVILTPHPGEMARLLKKSITEIQSNRIKYASILAKKTEATVILKGPGTIIVSENNIMISDVYVPALATPGTGDILSGLIGGFLSQKLLPIDAACFGVYAHALAGQEVEKNIGNISSKASDLFKYLPKTIKEIVYAKDK